MGPTPRGVAQRITRDIIRERPSLVLVTTRARLRRYKYLVGIRCLATVLQGSGATALRVLTALSRSFATCFRFFKLAQ